MRISLNIGGFGAAAVLSVPLFAAALFLAPAQARADSCNIIADQLSHQNTPLQDAANRLTTCARKYAKYDESLKSRSKSKWQSLCENNDKKIYERLVANRETILRRCRPRGSDD